MRLFVDAQVSVGRVVAADRVCLCHRQSRRLSCQLFVFSFTIQPIQRTASMASPSPGSCSPLVPPLNGGRTSSEQGKAARPRKHMIYKTLAHSEMQAILLGRLSCGASAYMNRSGGQCLRARRAVSTRPAGSL